MSTDPVSAIESGPWITDMWVLIYKERALFIQECVSFKLSGLASLSPIMPINPGCIVGYLSNSFTSVRAHNESVSIHIQLLSIYSAWYIPFPSYHLVHVMKVLKSCTGCALASLMHRLVVAAAGSY